VCALVVGLNCEGSVRFSTSGDPGGVAEVGGFAGGSHHEHLGEFDAQCGVEGCEVGGLSHGFDGAVEVVLGQQQAGPLLVCTWVVGVGGEHRGDHVGGDGVVTPFDGCGGQLSKVVRRGGVHVSSVPPCFPPRQSTSTHSGALTPGALYIRGL